MGNSREFFLKPIMAVTAAPRTEDVKAFVATYAKLLDDFDDDVLARAAETLLRTERIRTVPAPSDCIDACREAGRAIDLAKQRASRTKPKIREQFMWTPEMAKNADKLFASGWGKKAVADGVEIAVWDFMVKHQRWPNGSEYEKTKAESLRLQADMRDYLSEQKENGGIKAGAKAWVDTIARQSGRLKSLVLVGAL